MINAFEVLLPTMEWYGIIDDQNGWSGCSWREQIFVSRDPRNTIVWQKVPMFIMREAEKIWKWCQYHLRKRVSEDAWRLETCLCKSSLGSLQGLMDIATTRNISQWSSQELLATEERRYGRRQDYSIVPICWWVNILHCMLRLGIEMCCRLPWRFEEQKWEKPLMFTSIKFTSSTSLHLCQFLLWVDWLSTLIGQLSFRHHRPPHQTWLPFTRSISSYGFESVDNVIVGSELVSWLFTLVGWAIYDIVILLSKYH